MFRFRRSITQLTGNDLVNENANIPHNELQENVLYIYDVLLSTQTYVVPGVVNFYVNGTTGDDSNEGSEVEPFETVSRGLDEFGKILVGGGRIVVNVEGGQTYLPAAIKYLSPCYPIKTSAATAGVVLKATLGTTVIVDGQDAIDSFLELTNGLIVLEGTWIFRNFRGSAIEAAHGAIVTASYGANLTFEDNGENGLKLEGNSILLLSGAIITGSGNTEQDIALKTGSVFLGEDTSIGSIIATFGSHMSLIGESEVESEVHVPITLESSTAYLVGEGTVAADRLPIGYSPEVDGARIVARRGSTVVGRYLAVSIPTSAYPIQIQTNSNLYFAKDGLYLSGTGNGMFIDCSSTWVDQSVGAGEDTVHYLGGEANVDNMDLSCTGGEYMRYRPLGYGDYVLLVSAAGGINNVWTAWANLDVAAACAAANLILPSGVRFVKLRIHTEGTSAAGVRAGVRLRSRNQDGDIEEIWTHRSGSTVHATGQRVVSEAQAELLDTQNFQYSYISRGTTVYDITLIGWWY